jgi:DNA-binding beta-propeller fold protein YncE
VLFASFLGLVLPGSALGFGPLSSFGEFGNGAGQLDAPAQIAVAPDGDLYVADSGNDRISVFAGDGTFLRTFGGGLLSEPKDVALDAEGRAFVADTGNDRIDVFSATGGLLDEFGEGELDEPSGVAVDGSTVFVADTERVAAFTTAGGALPTPIEPAPLFSPRDVIVGGDGNLYVADLGQERIDVFGKAGGFIRSFGGTGTGQGELSGPVALVSDGLGGIYVADELAERVVHFKDDGGFLDSVDAAPNVAGVGIACAGNVFATESGTLLARVLRFGEPGTPPPPCTEPHRNEPIAAPFVKLPSNKFHFAGLSKNRSNGFAVLYVRVPGPGKVSLKGRGFRRLSRTVRQATTVSLPVKPKVRLRHFLKRHGKGRIRVEVTFTPTGGLPRTLEKVIVLRRHRG